MVAPPAANRLRRFFCPLKNHQVCRDDLGGIKLGVPVYRRSDIGWLMSAVVEGGNAL